MSHTENDTERLLRECDAGAKTAINAIEEVLDRAESRELRRLLTDSLETHRHLGKDIGAMLNRMGESGKAPGMMADTMSKMKIGMKMLAENSDHTVAELMIDGCNMGVKKLSEYLNQYTGAEKSAQDMAARLIDAEQAFADKLRLYL